MHSELKPAETENFKKEKAFVSLRQPLNQKTIIARKATEQRPQT